MIVKTGTTSKVLGGNPHLNDVPVGRDKTDAIPGYNTPSWSEVDVVRERGFGNGDAGIHLVDEQK